MMRSNVRRLASSLAINNAGLQTAQRRVRSTSALLLPAGDSFRRGLQPVVASRAPSRAAPTGPVAPQQTRRKLSTDSPSIAHEHHQLHHDSSSTSSSEFVDPSSLFGPRPDSWWTGRSPFEESQVPGRQPDGTISSLPQLMLRDCTKESLQAYFDNSWMLTESLFAGLQGEEAFLRPPLHGLRHPMIFYYGHPAALYVNKLRAAGIVQAPVNAYFEALLETGVDEMAWDDVGDDKMEWPTVAEVHSYREEVYRLVTSVIQTAPDGAIASIDMSSPYWALPMSMEHERIHIETSSVLIRELPLEYVTRPPTWPAPYLSGCGFGGGSSGDEGAGEGGGSSSSSSAAAAAATRSPVDNPLLAVEGGNVHLGKPRDFPSFGWDNEYGSREYSVPPFGASKYMVSNGEYLEFVKEAGYARQELWTDVGWRWKMFRNVKKPHFWVSEGPSGLHQYHLRTVFDEVPLPLDSPVITNFHEAKAFAAWKTMKEKEALGAEGRTYRLTTELEQRLLRGNDNNPSGTASPELIDPALSSAESIALGGTANANLTMGSETPVDAFPPNEMGFCDTRGNAWEWCEDHFSALSGFAISPLYEDFSTPCFDGEHHIIMGGSFASSGNEASVFARYHFRPHFHQHAGFRLVAPERREEATSFVTSCTDAPSPFVGSYPFRTSEKGSVSRAGWVTRDVEAERAVAAGLAAHFAVPEIAGKDAAVAQGLQYPQRCAQIVLRALEGVRPAGELHVVEVGCGAGGGSFELSKEVGKVVALDANKVLLDAASELGREGSLEVTVPSVGGYSVTQRVSLSPAANPHRIDFKQCDPMCLPAGLAGLDAALIHSTIDTIPSPNSLLARMGGARGIVRENGGIVVVVSAYEWNKEVTPVGAWLGDYLDDAGNQVPSVEGLSRGLGEDFKLVHVERVPCMRPLSDRRFEYVSAEATVWRRG
eukprot:g10612.t2